MRKWGVMVCEGNGMFNLHILVRLLENRRKTCCLMYVGVVPARRLVYVLNSHNNFSVKT